MMKVKIRKIGNSSVITLSDDMLALLDAKAGDTLYAVHTGDGGLELIKHSPELHDSLAADEAVMDENCDLLQTLE